MQCFIYVRNQKSRKQDQERQGIDKTILYIRNKERQGINLIAF